MISYQKLNYILSKRKITMKKLKKDAHLLDTDILAILESKALTPTAMFSICDYLQVEIFDIVTVRSEEI